MRKVLYVVMLALAAVVATGCQRDTVYADEQSVRLEFSEEKVTFDTVFATMGTTTRMVKVYNRSRNDIELSSVTLKHGRSSRFRLNVDGDTSMTAHNVELQAGDSMHIFIQANIDPNESNAPFLRTDSIMFSNGQCLPLEAYGRNAIYHRLKPGATTWFDSIDCANFRHDRPHVFLDPAAVLEGNTLTLLPGDELYFAAGAMLVIDSAASLVAVGTADQPILFSSVRHDPWYRTLPGQWQTIWFYNYSVGNVMRHCVVENAVGGLRCYPGSGLRVSNTVVRNCSDAGIIGQDATIKGDTMLVYDCLSSLVLIGGGDYRFNRCTLANYWNYSTRDTVGVIISNYYPISATELYANDMVRAVFKDCIIYGNRPREVAIGKLDGFLMDTAFVHSIVRGGSWDEDPMFTDVSGDDYSLQDGSPAIGIGYPY